MAKRKRSYLSGPEIAAMYPKVPVEYAMDIMNDENATKEERFAACVAVMGFVHPRLAVSQLAISEPARSEAEIDSEIAALFNGRNRRDLIGDVIEGEYTSKVH